MSIRRVGLVQRSGNAFEHGKGFVQKDSLVIVDNRVNLVLDTLPDLVKTFLADRQFVAEPIKGSLNAELVV